VQAPPVFDGHNDAILRLWTGGAEAVTSFREGSAGHVDLPRAREGGLAGGFFALFVKGDVSMDMDALTRPPYDIPLAAPIGADVARSVVAEQAAILHELDRRGDLALCRRAAEIEAAAAEGKLAALMHLEGAEAIGPDLEELDWLYGLGLRSIGPVWSRPTIFGHGVPFRFPSDGDTGPGLTEAGRRLVRAAAERGMIVDTSHLNLRGFFDIAETGIPVVATHSNAHAVCPTARNLTDDQLRVIGETGGMVGLNFATAFLRPDGRMVPDGALDWMVRHLDHMIALAGEDHVGLGSDFDGAVVPQEIGSAAGLGVLRERMQRAGYGADLIGKICGANWRAAIRRIIG
jgi:membrane dipeptidase